MSDLNDEILENAQGPRSAEGDGQRMQQHSLPDQIAADKHLAAKAARDYPITNLLRVKIVSAGSS